MLEKFCHILLLFRLIWMTTAQAYSQPQNVGDAADVARINRKLLETIRSNMDFEANPCEDFYQYACGNWEFVNWDEQKYVDTIGSLEYDTNEEMAAILERVIENGGRLNLVHTKLKDHYLACRATPNHDVKHYLKLLPPVGNNDDATLTWPQHQGNPITAWQGNNFNWLRTLGKLSAHGLDNVLLKHELKNKNSTDFILQIGKPDSVDFTSKEQEHISQLKVSQHEKDKIMASNLLAFSDKLRAFHVAYNDTRTPQTLTLLQLKERVIGLDISGYLQQVLHEQPNIIHADMLLLVPNIVYLRKLVDLVSRTNKDTLAYYIMLKLMTHLQHKLPLNNSPNYCMKHLRQHMPLAADYMYAREHYALQRNVTDAVIRNIFESMKAKFLSIIDEHTTEFTAEELQFLRQKLQLMRLNIGNLPDIDATPNAEHAFYKTHFDRLEIQRADFAANFLALLRHLPARRQHLLALHTPAVEHTFFTWPYASPAYLQTLNMLIIPFAYLRQPIFHQHYHELFLYAELGNTLGHEIMHGFDLLGLQYDAWGNPSTLFERAMTSPQFLLALDCLRREATSDINEKIADFSGFRMAYEAYFKREQVPKFRQERTLSNKQLFFVKFAQFFCAISPNRIEYDQTHDTPFKRVPQAVANMAEFAEEFGCASSTRMNPSIRCRIW